MHLDWIEKQFEAVGKVVGGVFLLPPQEALRFVEVCEQAGVAILGVEGFKWFGERIQPQQEHSFDLLGPTEGSHEYTHRFIAERIDSELWFEVVADVPHENATNT